MRWNLLDGVRGMAAMLVLLSHVAFWTGAAQIDTVGRLLARGDSGVAIFFALSAFLLLRPHYRAALSGSQVNAEGYARRRAARVLPAYWVALIAVLLAAVALPGVAGVGDPWKVFAHVFVLQGWTGETYQAMTQTWSLTTEITFYLGVPLIGRLIRRHAHPRVDRHFVILAAIGGVGVALQGLAAAVEWPVLATSAPAHAAWFAVGAAAALGVETWSAGLAAPRATAAVAPFRHDPMLALLAAGLIYLAVATPWGGPVGLSEATPASLMFKEVAYAALAAMVLLAALEFEHRRTPSPRLKAGCAWAGELSYAVFLWHVLVLQVLYSVTGRPLFSGGFWWVLIATVGLSVAIATLSARFVEAPAIRWARSRNRQPAQQR
ncbi:acyltransferase family protein [Demetria terragena]|uniref:acyltransferase family protein n=1 Tax=Demetria terragena TaxID=63959 RepID=UPI00036FAC1B|nr:acyltransferase [Demetria terragena]